MLFFLKKNLWFIALGAATLICFFSFRPLNAPAYRIIAADGLGYYSYLPAQFIYHDTQLSFGWFDTVFNKHYNNRLFEYPHQNFMVPYGSKEINKYYPGQSLLQLPFFLAGHAAAKLFGCPADGFSLPYQLAIGLASVFYALLGLYFCRRLLQLVFNNRLIPALVPLLIFFGSNLFTYTVFNGCYSHAYSFCFLSLACYSAYLFFNRPAARLFYFLLTALFCLVVLSIRPLNGVLLLSLFYFYKPFSLKDFSMKQENKFRLLFLLLLMLLVGAYSLNIIYTQTHTFLINTYIGEKFYFNDWSHIGDNFFGFQYGMLWYTPLLLLCLCALLLVFKQPRLVFLLAPVLCIILLYSFWWYWNIVARAVVDSSVILALLLGHVLMNLSGKRLHRPVLAMTLLCVPFFQLKAYQLRNGIIDSNYTYFKYYAKYFFTMRQVNIFPVNPRTVISVEEHFQDFEQQSGNNISNKQKFEGGKAAVLNAQEEYAGNQSAAVPDFIEKEGFKKVKAAFWLYATEEISNIHFIFTFMRHDSSVAYVPFYMNRDNLRHNRWEYKEFGMDVPKAVKPGDELKVYFWNPDRKSAAFIDNLKIEFFLTNGADEVTLK